MASGDVREAKATELVRAWERVGRTPDARARWLFTFERADVAHLSAGDWLNVRWEILGFVYPSGPPPIAQAPPVDLARQCHGWVRRGLTGLRTTGRWPLEAGRQRYMLRYADEKIEAARLWRGAHFWADVGQAFRQEVLRALSTPGIRIRMCRRCGALFVARKRQAYCTTRCSQTYRTAKYRQAHAARARRQRHSTVIGS